MTDIRKFMKLVELGDINPSAPVARDSFGRVLHPDVNYDVSDNKVVATLMSYKSQTYTKLAQKIDRVTQLEKEADQLKEEIKQEGREQIADLFSADDACRTRVIDTVSFIMKITKDPEAATTVKYAKVIEELETKLTPELVKVMEAIVAKYSTVQKAKPAALSYEPKATESLDLSEGVLDMLANVLAKFKNTILNWGKKYDAKLQSLEMSLAMGEAVDRLSMPAQAPMASESHENFFREAFMKGTEVDEDEEAQEQEGEESVEEAMMGDLNGMTGGASKVDEADYDQYNKVGAAMKPKGNWGDQFSRQGDAQSTQAAFPEMLSTWQKGDQIVYVWKKGDDAYVVDSKGKRLPLKGDPKTPLEIEVALKGTYGFQRAGSKPAMAEDDMDVGQPPEMPSSGGAPSAPEMTGLTEYGEPAEDAYPDPATLDDAELSNFMTQWDIGARYADPQSESGQAFMAFGKALKAECTARGIC